MKTSQVGLAKQAYQGAPKGVAHVWPDDVDWSKQPHWSFDESKRTKSKRQPSKASILKQDLLNTI